MTTLRADTGIVFHYLNYSETSVIVKLLTEQSGMLSVLKKGARKKGRKSNLAALQPLSIVSVEYYHNEQKELHLAKSIEIWRPYRTVQTEMLKSAVFMFLNEVLFKSLQHQEANKQLYTFILEFLIRFDQEELNPNAHLWFLLQLCSFLGISPDSGSYRPGSVLDIEEGIFRSKTGRRGESTAEEASFLYQLLGTKFAAITSLKVSTELRRKTLQTLVEYYETQLEGMRSINSHLVLKELME